VEIITQQILKLGTVRMWAGWVSGPGLLISSEIFPVLSW